MNYLNPRHLKAFVTVADKGSLAGAAAQLHLGQPAISQALANLETLTGVKLISRSTRSLQLTPAGAMFYKDALRVLEENDRLLQHANQWATARQGSVSILSIPSIAHLLLPRVVKAFRARHPEVAVEVHDHPDPQLRLRIQQGEGDFAIVTGGSQAPDMLILPLLKDRLRWIGPPGHPLAGAANLSCADLRGEQLILLRPGSVFRTMAEPILKKIKNALPPIEVDQLATLMGMVSAGLGVSLIPGLSCPPEQHAHIVHRAIESDRCFRTIALVRPQERDLMPAALAFVRLMARQLDDDRLRLPPGVSFLAPSPDALDDFLR